MFMVAHRAIILLVVLGGDQRDLSPLEVVAAGCPDGRGGGPRGGGRASSDLATSRFSGADTGSVVPRNVSGVVAAGCLDGGEDDVAEVVAKLRHDVRCHERLWIFALGTVLTIVLVPGE